MKRIIPVLAVIAIAAVALAMLAGCAPSSKGPKAQKVVYLINGALGDNAFYDSGKAGIDAHRRPVQGGDAHDRVQLRRGQVPARRCRRRWTMPM